MGDEVPGGGSVPSNRELLPGRDLGGGEVPGRVSGDW